MGAKVRYLSLPDGTPVDHYEKQISVAATGVDEDGNRWETFDKWTNTAKALIIAGAVEYPDARSRPPAPVPVDPPIDPLIADLIVAVTDTTSAATDAKDRAKAALAARGTRNG